MQLFDDLEDFGAFDEAVSGNVRDPYGELAKMRREQPVQRLDTSLMPHEESKPVFLVYRYDDIAQMLRDNETFSSSIVIDAFGDALGKQRARRGHVDQHRARLGAGHDAIRREISLLHVGRKAHDRDDEIGLRRGAAGRGVPLGAGIDQRLGFFLGAVVDVQRVARLLEVAGHAAAHDAGADECDGRHVVLN